MKLKVLKLCIERKWAGDSGAVNRCWRKQGHGENRGYERDRHKQSRVDNPPTDQTASDSLKAVDNSGQPLCLTARHPDEPPAFSGNVCTSNSFPLALIWIFISSLPRYDADHLTLIHPASGLSVVSLSNTDFSARLQVAGILDFLFTRANKLSTEMKLKSLHSCGSGCHARRRK